MTDKAPERIWPDKIRIRDTGFYDDLGGAGQRIYTTAGQGYEKREYVPLTTLEAAQARIAELEADRRASLLGVIAMALSCGGELRVNPKARQSCQQYSLHAHDDPETGDMVLSVRALKEKPNG